MSDPGWVVDCTRSPGTRIGDREEGVGVETGGRAEQTRGIDALDINQVGAANNGLAGERERERESYVSLTEQPGTGEKVGPCHSKALNSSSANTNDTHIGV